MAPHAAAARHSCLVLSMPANSRSSDSVRCLFARVLAARFVAPVAVHAATIITGVAIALTLAPAGAGAQAAAAAYGRVLADSTDAAIGGATITIPQLHVAATSDSLGRFALRGIKPGEHLIIVRRIGFAPFSTVLRFAPGDSLDADFLLVPVPQRLTKVDVVGAHVSPKLAEFEERRTFGIGHFLTQEEIEKRGATRTTDVLRILPGLVMVRANARGDLYVGSSRGAQSLRRAGGSRPCRAQIVLDGVPMPEGVDVGLDQAVPLTDIAALEWYAGPAQMPAKYSSTKNMCAVLVVWTK